MTQRKTTLTAITTNCPKRRARKKIPYALKMKHRLHVQGKIEAVMRALPLSLLSESYPRDAFCGPALKKKSERQIQLEAKRQRRRAVGRYRVYIPQLAERLMRMGLYQITTQPAPARNVVDTQIKNAGRALTKALLCLSKLDPVAADALHLAREQGLHPPAETLVMSRTAVEFERPLPSLGRLVADLETAIRATFAAKIFETAKSDKGTPPRSRCTGTSEGSSYKFLFLDRNAADPWRRRRRLPSFLEAGFRGARSARRQRSEYWQSSRRLVGDWP